MGSSSSWAVWIDSSMACATDQNRAIEWLDRWRNSLYGSSPRLRLMPRPKALRSITPIDIGAGLVALVALAGVIWSPKLSNAVARATGSLQPVKVSVDVKHLYSSDPEALLQSARDEGSTSIVVRNQPAGRVRLIEVDDITRRLVAVQPDGKVVEAEDPNLAQARYVRFELEADAETDSSGVVIGGTKLKVGVPVELEGSLYRLNGIVSGVTLP